MENYNLKNVQLIESMQEAIIEKIDACSTEQEINALRLQDFLNNWKEMIQNASPLICEWYTRIKQARLQEITGEDY